MVLGTIYVIQHFLGILRGISDIGSLNHGLFGFKN